MEILVKVIPNSKNIEIFEEWNDLLTNRAVYRVKLTAKPVDNQANIQLIGTISEYFNVKKRFVRIVKWENSKSKLIKIVEK